jgi:alkanesulfonate monooxygenase SsuD/methylene tetrahydromethanopterin reductase-like flavin-dependent oxidoreductase (luciferase family)
VVVEEDGVGDGDDGEAEAWARAEASASFSKAAAAGDNRAVNGQRGGAGAGRWWDWDQVASRLAQWFAMGGSWERFCFLDWVNVTEGRRVRERRGLFIEEGAYGMALGGTSGRPETFGYF